MNSTGGFFHQRDLSIKNKTSLPPSPQPPFSNNSLQVADTFNLEGLQSPTRRSAPLDNQQKHSESTKANLTYIMLRLFALYLLLCAPHVAAWTSGSLGSSFAGSTLIVDRSVTYSDSMTMKKGKPNVPPQMRGQYKKQQQMRSMQEEMRAATKPGADGLPVFNLYIRSKTAKVRNGLVLSRSSAVVVVEIFAWKVFSTCFWQTQPSFSLFFFLHRCGTRAAASRETTGRPPFARATPTMA